VHRRDAARLFRFALEQADAGAVVHAVADEGDTMLSLAEEIGRQLGIPTKQVPSENFGPLATIFSIDQPASSTWTREHFGWDPTHPSLRDDLEAGNYLVARG
jgi:nucleoside-diphosphate-sugar epimerase